MATNQIQGNTDATGEEVLSLNRQRRTDGAEPRRYRRRDRRRQIPQPISGGSCMSTTSWIGLLNMVQIIGYVYKHNAL